jgi:hypothetical protein
MTVIRPGRGIHIVANKLLTHAAPHYQGGLVGIVQKQDEPKAFDSLASRTQVQNGVKYFLITKGETELPALAGATVGQAVFINTTTDALTLTQGTGETLPFGRVTNLPGTFGLNSTTMRVDMDLKDDITVK